MQPRNTANDPLYRHWESWIKKSEKLSADAGRRGISCKQLRVGIATTLTQNYNYGAILQAYALQRFLSLFAPNCRQIAYDKQKNYHGARVTPSDGASKARMAAANGVIKRKRAMQRFIDTIPQSAIVYNNVNILSSLNSFDAFVCGSDVIWSNRSSLSEHSFYWLNFVPGGRKIKIAYAPSLRVQDWSVPELIQIRRFASSFDALSVRESASREFLERLLDGEKPVRHTLDPTLLVPAEAWRQMSRPASSPKVDGKFIFAYMLGDNPGQRAQVVEFARSKRLPIVTLPHCVTYRADADGFGDARLYDIDPAQWVWLMDHAEFVFTDSFHGAIFSAIFQRRFYIFKRRMSGQWSSLGERVKSLTAMWKIESSVLTDEGGLREIERVPDINYARLEAITERMQNSSAEFIVNALHAGVSKLNKINTNNNI
ncbi:MAG: polysaccharide pyruvyl transferase family protein [Oscillospiraceae bacterium]|jgi:hypothetical protein|nr:polysaccharide pyruvyl transferase family protein [Oscillospiraceae bacterium]